MMLHDNEEKEESSAVYETTLFRVFIRSLARSGGVGTDWSSDEILKLHKCIAEAPLGDERTHARHALARTAMYYLVKVAFKYRTRLSRGIEITDLISFGYEGLFRATDDFDPSRGAFTTYATAWIENYIRKGIADMSRAVRVPFRRLYDISCLVRNQRELRGKFLREPSLGELAHSMELDISKTDSLRLLISNEISIDAQPDGNDDGDEGLHAILGSDDLKVLDEQIHHAEVCGALRTQVERLPLRERNIIAMRFGFGEFDPMTLDEIGVQYGVSGERIRQIERDAINKLRCWLCEK